MFALRYWPRFSLRILCWHIGLWMFVLVIDLANLGSEKLSLISDRPRAFNPGTDGISSDPNEGTIEYVNRVTNYRFYNATFLVTRWSVIVVLMETLTYVFPTFLRLLAAVVTAQGLFLAACLAWSAYSSEDIPGDLLSAFNAICLEDYWIVLWPALCWLLPWRGLQVLALTPEHPSENGRTAIVI